ncbi:MULTISPECIES: DUF2812 domain-containing protein [Methanobacterium]|uniref:DUF2812 domain-containing protein n=1 Tax=Methanobacterium bryantii TaxID=2161 RepID=A0A2A2H6Y5_METBR|nr:MULTISPECIES: DUF2812 domain-containing protein [Methanobacterium]OEC85832.1 hypothetical protein A9507_12365 [Methanobacterium sp. A39]PAV05013.1 hypothetical protein ASJ80_11970 [Methanobacterium bryantii]
MGETKTACHWWWGWNPEKIENWLEEMELNGWNLVSVGFAYIVFKFEKGESRKMRYCVDYQINVGNNYFELFKADGWELADDKIIPWYIWRKPYENERQSIYTDTKSLIERNNRLIKTVGILVPLEIVVFYLLLEHNSGIVWALVFIVLILTFLGYVTAQLYLYNKKLEKSEIRL